MLIKIQVHAMSAALISFITACCLLLLVGRGLYAADSDLKPGDTIGPHNWQKVQGMVGENLLNRIGKFQDRCRIDCSREIL